MLLALDLSLNSTGYVIGSGPNEIILHGAICPSKKLSQYSRVQSNLSEIKKLISAHNVHTVIIEDQALGKKSGSTKILGEQQGVIKFALWEMGVAVAGVSITEWKLYFCGTGAASKELIRATCLDLGYEFGTQDECDALGIYAWAMAQDVLPVL